MKELPENAAPVLAVVKIVADAYGLEAADLLGARRFKELTKPRQVAMYVVTEVVGHSSVHAQRWMGKDNSTIFHARRVIGEAINTDPQLEQRVRAITVRVRNWREEICKPAAGPTSDRTLPLWTDEAHRLHREGWSVGGIARHLGKADEDVAQVVGVRWRKPSFAKAVA
jgi:hypothetical protein